MNCDKLGDGKRFNEMTEGEAKGGGGVRWTQMWREGFKMDDTWTSGTNRTEHLL